MPVFATPFALAALGLIVCERAGVLNLGAEGFMLTGALAGFAAAHGLALPPLVALLAGALAGALYGALFAALTVLMRVNQVIVGLTLVFMAGGFTTLIADARGYVNRSIAGLGDVPLGPLADLPAIGPVLFGQDALVYATPLIVAAAVLVLARSTVGLRLRAVGDNPEAADAAGVNVTLYRLIAVLVGCALVGLAGAYLTVAVSKIWVDHVTGGRGWIAVALVIFARWSPWRALAGALLFGGIEALIPRVAAAGVPVPQYLLLTTPYLVTLAVMVWSARRPTRDWREPAALGQPFLREERT